MHTGYIQIFPMVDMGQRGPLGRGCRWVGRSVAPKTRYWKLDTCVKYLAIFVYYKGQLWLDAEGCGLLRGLCEHRDRKFSIFLQHATIHCVKCRPLCLVWTGFKPPTTSTTPWPIKYCFKIIICYYFLFRFSYAFFLPIGCGPNCNQDEPSTNICQKCFLTEQIAIRSDW